ncbi:hypothetical protein NDU88_002023 [Pleurodeles waltl]|uniref:Uncharacterized protein n=1 Tax=Pleurodeles waltl TaxID=8319 RepID=A0AAV7P757_PLEWA|nr:hypothetical protein NDU88_002023 [Pleurodeles waltl]
MPTYDIPKCSQTKPDWLQPSSLPVCSGKRVVTWHRHLTKQPPQPLPSGAAGARVILKGQGSQRQNVLS